jgi:HEAT repeat protein
LVLPARAAEPAAVEVEREVQAVFVKVDQLLARQNGADARSIASLDSEIESLSPAVLSWRWRAVAPLARILEERERPLKARLYALSFLAMTHDPLALPPLTRLLLDEQEPESLRSAAASDLGSLGVSRQAQRAALCAALAQEALPEAVARQVLPEAARLGCDDTAVLEGWARRGGLRPEGARARQAELAVAALGNSRPIEAARALVRLLAFYPAGSAMKPLVMHSLWQKRRDLPALRTQASAALGRTIRAESGHPPIVAAALPVLAAVGSPDDVPLLRRLLGHPDAEVVTAAAEALAELQFFPARDDISAILARIDKDPRFAPAAGRPDPLALISRLQAAQSRLR